MPETRPPSKHPTFTTLHLIAMSGEVGLILAVPLVIMLLIGVKLDKALGTTPLCILLGLLGSLTTSSYAIWRKIKTLK